MLTSQVLPIVVPSNVSHSLEEEYHIMLLLFSLEKMGCAPETILCKMYVMKIWEGMV